MIAKTVRLLSSAALLLSVSLLFACGGASEEPVATSPTAPPVSAVSDSGVSEVTTAPAAPADVPAMPDMEMTEPERPDPNTVVARINGEDVLQHDVDEEMVALFQRATGGRLPLSLMEQFRDQLTEQALEQLVFKRQLAKYAADNGIAPTAEEIEESLNEIAMRNGGLAAFEQTLAGQGMTLDEARERIRNDMALNDAIQHFRDSISSPPDQDIADFVVAHASEYETDAGTPASHILILSPREVGDPTATAKRSLAEEIRQKLLDGADFAEMAAQYSEDPGSAHEGGDVGPVNPNQMVPEFEAAVFTLEPGAISELVQTDYGFHIIRVPTFEERALTDMEHEAMNTWRDTLIQSAQVERLD